MGLSSLNDDLNYVACLWCKRNCRLSWLLDNVVSPTSMCMNGIAQTCIRLKTLSHYGFESYVGDYGLKIL